MCPSSQFPAAYFCGAEGSNRHNRFRRTGNDDRDATVTSCFNGLSLRGCFSKRGSPTERLARK